MDGDMRRQREEEEDCAVGPWVPTEIDLMTKEEFKTAIDKLGISQTWFGTWIGRDRHQINRWVRGFSPVPRWMPLMLLLLERERARLKLDPRLAHFEFPLEAVWPMPLVLMKKEEEEDAA